VLERTSGLSLLSKFHSFSTLANRGGKARWAAELRSILLITAIILAGALLYVWQHIQVIRLGYRVEQLNAEFTAMIQEERELTVKIAQLKSLARIEEMARRKLGMVEPTPSQIIIVSPERYPTKAQAPPKGRSTCVKIPTASR